MNRTYRPPHARASDPRAPCNAAVSRGQSPGHGWSRHVPGTVPGTCLQSARLVGLAVPVRDGVVEAEELAGGPGADLVRVGIDRRPGMLAVRPDEEPRRLV